MCGSERPSHFFVRSSASVYITQAAPPPPPRRKELALSRHLVVMYPQFRGSASELASLGSVTDFLAKLNSVEK